MKVVAFHTFAPLYKTSDMKTLAKIALVAMTISSVSFVGCKKGEDDPFLSLSSRKARVAGEWKMTDYKSTDTDVTGVTTVTSNGATYTVNTPVGSFNGTWTREGTFEKDGTYTTTEVIDGDSETSKGTWNFTSGVGELKNKSQITLYETSLTSGSNTSSWTGNYVDVAYDLKELRKKKMVWYMKVTSTSGSSTSTFEETITYEPK